jgi:hypothetical protein
MAASRKAKVQKHDNVAIVLSQILKYIVCKDIMMLMFHLSQEQNSDIVFHTMKNIVDSLPDCSQIIAYNYQQFIDTYYNIWNGKY